MMAEITLMHSVECVSLTILELIKIAYSTDFFDIGVKDLL